MNVRNINPNKGDKTREQHPMDPRLDQIPYEIVMEIPSVLFPD